jgi:hypothetical protein
MFTIKNHFTMKNVILFFITLSFFSSIDMMAQPYMLDVDGRVIIREFSPTLELFDSRPSENRLEGSLSELFDHIILRSYKGNLVFVADTAGELTQRMSISAANGNVSIGNTFPFDEAKLQVFSKNSWFWMSDYEIGGQGLNANEILAAEILGQNSSNPVIRLAGYTPNYIDLGMDGQGNFMVKQINNIGLSVLTNGNVGINGKIAKSNVHLVEDTSALMPVSNISTSFALSGNTKSPRIYFEHLAANSGERVMGQTFEGGVMSWDAYNNGGLSTIHDDIWTMSAGTGNIGVGMIPNANKLSVNGDASKTSAGDWLANSDARLKKDIHPLNSNETLNKVLALKGITYQWNDEVTGYDRPTGHIYGFTAQNIQEVFPELVSQDDQGYLQTAYGTYDAMYVECIRALNEKIEKLEAQVSEIDAIKKQLAELTAACKN